MFKSIKPIINTLKGSVNTFPERQRSFNIICALCIVTFLVFLGFDLANLSPHLGLVLLLSITILVTAFYISRIKNRFNLAFGIFEANAYLFLSIGFILNEGIDGPVLFIYFGSLLVHLATNPQEKVTRYLIGHAIAITSGIAFQYYFPEYIWPVYSSKALRYVDFLLTALFALGFFAVVFNAIKAQFARGKKVIELKNRELVANKKELTKTLEQKEHLIRIIAHDLRSPLASIQEYLNMLQSDDFDVDKPSRASLEKNLGELTHGASKMLHELLEWNKERETDPNFEPINATLVFEEILNTGKHKAEIKDIEVNVEQLNQTPLALADKHMLLIALRNLFDNAVKFTPEGGKITVKLAQTELHTSITIADSGVGISERQIEKLFKSPVTSNPGTANEVGTGLGLFVTHGLIEKMGGTLKVKSRPGQGTSFTVLLEKAADAVLQ